MKIQRVVVALALAAASGSAFGAAFTTGNLVVLQIGTGAAPLAGTAQASSLVEFTTMGTSVQTLALPTASAGLGGQRALTFSGTATSEGALTRSADGSYLTLGGYDAIPGATIANTTAAAVNRVIGRVDFNGSIDTSTAITDNPGGSGANMRGAVSADGSGFWFTGGGSATGVRYVPFGTQGTSTQVATTPGNSRIVNIFGNQLYASAATAGFLGVGAVGTGLPIMAGSSSTLLSGVGGTGTSIYDFILAGPTTLYVADDSAANGGLSKFSFNGTTWVLDYRITAGLGTNFLRQITGGMEGSDYVIYGTSGDGRSIIRLVDAGAGSSFSVIATAPANTAFRGIDFAPVPTPGAFGLLGLGGLAAARRRR